MVSFINEHRGAYGVEPICRVLPIAPSTYYEHKMWEMFPWQRSLRVRQDEFIRPEIRRVWKENLEVYGAKKV